MRFLFLFFLLTVLSRTVAAENVNTTGALSFLSLSKEVSKYSTLNFYHYDIFNFRRKELEGRTFDAGISQAYFQLGYSYQYLPSLSLSVGYIYQRSSPFLADPQNEHRIFQQLVYSPELKGLTVTHRIRFEERFIDTEDGSDLRTRLRYQLGVKRALRGLTIDPGEFYLNTYNEFYFSTSGERNALFSDDWLFLGLGYQTKELGSLELGPLAQWSRINADKDTRTHYLVQFGWILKFK